MNVVDTNEHLTAVADVNQRQFSVQTGLHKGEPIFPLILFDESVEVLETVVNTGSWVKVQLFGQGQDQTITFSQETVVISVSSDEENVFTCVTSDTYFDFYIALPNAMVPILERPVDHYEKLGVCIPTEMAKISSEAENTANAWKAPRTLQEYVRNMKKWHNYFKNHVSPQMHKIASDEPGVHLNYHLLTKDYIGKFLNSRKKIKLNKRERKLVTEAEARGKKMYTIFRIYIITSEAEFYSILHTLYSLKQLNREQGHNNYLVITPYDEYSVTQLNQEQGYNTCLVDISIYDCVKWHCS